MGNSKEEARERVKILVDKFNEYKEQDLLKGYNEDNTCKDFILPLFRALGWGVETSKEVEGQKTVSSGRVDYAFYLDGIPKFYLEAKSVPEDLNDEKYVKQAINYAYNKGVTWAVLSNFDRIKIFNAEWHTEPSKACVLNLSIDDYLTDFDLLWELSKEGIRQELLYDRARKFGQIATKEPVGERLYQDLTIWRQEFFKYISGYHKKDFTFAQVDEIIQRILNRLVFIRTCEDREIEQPFLLPLVREWKASRKFRLEKKLQELFKDFNGWYNSKLFTHHSCDEIDTEDTPYAEVIEGLYGSKDEIVRYDFSALSVDVLGRVYEQYLGYVAKAVEPKKRKQLVIDGFDEKTIILEKEKKRRKEQGIYYTPSFIVDYIVNNALRPVLDKCRDVSDLKKIKVLDPACGSGSFLIKALEVINNKYREFDYKGDELTKIQILEENLYGVDLDEQAIEITRLNLLINSLDRRKELPFLKHIKNGNSLISGSDEELKERFGKNFMDKKPFNWEEEFPEVFKQGGFDVIIGNPPWVTVNHKEIGADTTKYFKDKYKGAEGFKLNLFPMFVELALRLTKNGGIFCFIIPNRLLDTPSYAGIRKEIIGKYTILDIENLPEGSFDQVVAGNIILIVEKTENNKDNIIIKNFHSGEILSLSITSIVDDPNLTININTKTKSSQITDKVDHKKILKLKDLCNIHVGMMVKNKKEMFKDAPIYKYKIVTGRDLSKYSIARERYFNPESVEIFGGTKNKDKHLEYPKLFVRKTGNTIICSIDEVGRFAEQSVYLVLLRNKNFDIKFLAAILNSKLITFYFKNKLITNPGSYPYIQHYDLENMPIIDVDKEQQRQIIILVAKMLKLNKEVQETLKNSEKWNSIKSEIEKTDRKIDEEVYKLYGLTSEERKIVESS